MKIDRKDIYNVKDFCFKSFFFFTFYSSQNPNKTLYHGWSSPAVFNIDYNNKYFILFLSSKSVYYTDFWRSCDTEDWTNSALITEINSILKYINTENSYFKLL